MTICIAAIAESNGAPKIVFCADKRVTSQDQGVEAGTLAFEHGGSKISFLSRNCVVLTAGRELKASPIRIAATDRIKERFGNGEVLVSEAVNVLMDCLRQGRVNFEEDTVLLPLGERMGSLKDNFSKYPESIAQHIFTQLQGAQLEIEFIVAGLDSKGPHIYELDETHGINCYDSIGFLSIGSGAMPSMFEITKFSYTPVYSVGHATYLVYSSKLSSERASGVGQLTDIGVMFSDADGVKSIPIGLDILNMIKDTRAKIATTEIEEGNLVSNKINETLYKKEEKQNP